MTRVRTVQKQGLVLTQIPAVSQITTVHLCQQEREESMEVERGAWFQDNCSDVSAQQLLQQSAASL